MNFSLYMLLFLIFGTLFFGFAFPFIIMFGGVLIIAFAIFALLRFLRGGSGFTVYTSRGASGRAEEQQAEPQRRRIYADGPRAPHESARRAGDYINVAADDEEMAEAVEVVELPATALRKDDEEESR